MVSCVLSVGSDTIDDDASAASPMFQSSSRSGHSSHAPPPTVDAMRGMFLLELKFAALRDQLYIDRMDEAAREEDLILTGDVTGLSRLTTRLAPCRCLLTLDLGTAARAVTRGRSTTTQNGIVGAPKGKGGRKGGCRQLVARECTPVIPSNIQETREATQWSQYEGNWRKRRRLNREKSELEILRPVKSLPPKFPSEKDMNDRSFRWSGGPRASTLSAADIGIDLTNMGVSFFRMTHLTCSLT